MRTPRFLSTLTSDRTSWEALVAACVALLAVGLDPQLLDAPVRGHDREHRDGLPPGYLDAATQGVRASLVIASGVAIAAGVVADPYLGRTGALGTT